MDIKIVPMLDDNYGYLIVDLETKECACVDPVEPAKIIAAAKECGATITHVLTTHSHWDHAGGNVALVKELGSEQVAFVVGGIIDEIPMCTHPSKHGDKFGFGKVVITVLDTPCHTPGHISFIASHEDGGRQALFTGDTLFVGGAGNLNAGTPEQLHHALCNIYAKLTGDTLVYVGHEYTVKNLQWATVVEPSNDQMKYKLEWAMAMRADGRPTVPTTISDEMSTNPFMRCETEAVQAWAGLPGDAVQTLMKVRTGKDEWGRKK